MSHSGLPAARGRTVVAMSGGVDSSVAALLLTRAGVDVVGVSMQVWDYRQHGGCSTRATCCAPDDFTDARKVAARIQVPYYVVDFETTFRREVIDRFVRSYEQGITPNPCVDCNNRVKFRSLRERAASFGCSTVATGHYARITVDDAGWHLRRGVDPAKDQSYFLYGLTQAELSTTLFPVGDLTKAEVREIARAAGLVTAEKAESQDICFVAGEVRDFVRRIGRTEPRTGPIVTRAGEVVGNHDGVAGFTVGQRRGLAVGGSAEPLYVLELVPESNTVVVGPRGELERSGFTLAECSWVAPAVRALMTVGQEGAEFPAIAQLRHRHPGVPVRVCLTGPDRAAVTFTGAWTTVTPGQAAVLYDLANDEVLGGGRIEPSGTSGALV